MNRQSNAKNNIKITDNTEKMLFFGEGGAGGTLFCESLLEENSHYLNFYVMPYLRYLKQYNF